jgi:hypothetical protein
MANVVTDLIYELADTLQLTIKESRSAPKLSGEGSRTVSLGGLTVPMKARIVSSQTGKSGAMILVRMQGNLVVFAEATRVQAKAADRTKLKVSVLLLNLARMGRVENFLESVQPRDGKVVENLLKKAVVGKFERLGTQAWQKAAHN